MKSISITMFVAVECGHQWRSQEGARVRAAPGGTCYGWQASEIILVKIQIVSFICVCDFACHKASAYLWSARSAVTLVFLRLKL